MPNGSAPGGADSSNLYLLRMVDRNLILWYTLPEPEWRNRQTRATQNRVGLAHVGSIPTSGTWSNWSWAEDLSRRPRAVYVPRNAASF